MQNSLAVLVCLLWSGLAHAAAIEQPLADPTKEQLSRTIFHELRCMVCEGQSVADSDAKLASQMRDHVRRLVTEGKSEREVLETFRKSYGDTILLTPPVEESTALLWLAPLILLIIGATLVWRTTHPRTENP